MRTSAAGNKPALFTAQGFTLLELLVVVALIAIATAENIGLIVLGLPVNMDGTEGPRCQSTRSFARNFGKLSPIPIVFWDERLSTAAVERMLIQADVPFQRISGTWAQREAQVREVLAGLQVPMR